ncbi:MAG: hypothetical protein NTV19_13915 [Burkholderiales bacterium]|nr:hypothetical protein [Burkholderiales bacterium]
MAVFQSRSVRLSRSPDLRVIAGWGSVALVWVSAGLFWREPWKADEGYSVGIVLSMVRDAAVLVPTLAGEPFMEKPPLIYWLAALAAGAFEGPLAFHEAARLANVAVILGAALSLASAARIAFNGRRIHTTLLWLAASPFWLISSRYLITDIGLVLAAAMVTNGLVRLERGKPAAGGWLGLGAGVGLMSKGLLLPGITALTVIALIWIRPALRSAHTVRQLAWALAAVLPAILIWPTALWWHAPALFDTWFFTNNIGRFVGTANLGAVNDRLWLLPTAALLLLPSWPCAGLALADRMRRGTANGLLGTALFAAGWLPVLLASAAGRSLYLLPMVAPLALLAAAWQPRIRQPARRRMTLLMLILAVVSLGALAITWLLHHWGEVGAEVSPTQLLLAALALAASLLLIGSGRLRTPLTVWVCSLTTAWACALALFLPAADQNTGFREVFTELVRQMPQGGGCVASRGLGESERAMLHYYGGILTLRTEVDPRAGTECPVLIEQQRLAAGSDPPSARRGCSGLIQRWEGTRPNDERLVFRVCTIDPD